MVPVQHGATWTSSPLTGKGASLQFVAPIVKDGRKLAQMQKAEVDKLTEKCVTSLVMYVVGDVPTIASVKRYIVANWNQVGTPTVFLHDYGYFVLHFSTIVDRDGIISGGPYTFFNRPVILKPWAPVFNFYEEVLRVIPMWIKLPNLPLNCWRSDSLSRIASLLGVLICVDDCTSRQERVSFARMLVEMDVTAALPNHVCIEDSNGREFKQSVIYDWKPSYCHKCQMARHDCCTVVHRQEQAKKNQ